MKRLLVIDGDIIAYKAAARAEEEIDFGDGAFISADAKKAREICMATIEGFRQRLFADHVKVCLSDPKKNWRKRLEPTYKGNRQDARKPELIMPMKEYMYNEYGSSVREWLEADDVMGMMATGIDDKEVVIVSEDKDMRTIPGLVYNPDRPKNGIMEISPTEANQFLLWQALTGDQTDGYPGCPGIGKTSLYAQDVLTLEDPLDMWNCVLDGYASKGLTEKDAVHQARLAHICRHHSYDSEKSQVRLWNPTFLYHY